MIYFIRSGEFVKIGHCRHNVKQRMGKLQIGNPTTLELLGVAGGGPADERDWHSRFDKLRVRGEWFRLDSKLLRAIEPHKNGAPLNMADLLYPSVESLSPSHRSLDGAVG